MQILSFPGQYIDERMYLLQSGKRIILIDAVRNEKADAYLKQIRPHDVWIILTHEHIDHIYGVNDLKKKFPCRVLCSQMCSAAISDPKLNMARYQEVILGRNDTRSELDFEYRCEADQTFEKKYSFDWQGHMFRLYETPGHSRGSICILLNDSVVFTGDTLLKNDPVITRLPEGDRIAYRQKTLPFLHSLPPDSYVYPGHGEAGMLKDCALEREG